MADKKTVEKNLKTLYDDAVSYKMFKAATPTFDEFRHRMMGDGYQNMVYKNYREHGFNEGAFADVGQFRDWFSLNHTDEVKAQVIGQTQDMLDNTDKSFKYSRIKNEKTLQKSKKLDVTPKLKSTVANPLDNENVVRDNETGKFLDQFGNEYKSKGEASYYQTQYDEAAAFNAFNPTTANYSDAALHEIGYLPNKQGSYVGVRENLDAMPIDEAMAKVMDDAEEAAKQGRTKLTPEEAAMVYRRQREKNDYLRKSLKDEFEDWVNGDNIYTRPEYKGSGHAARRESMLNLVNQFAVNDLSTHNDDITMRNKKQYSDVWKEESMNVEKEEEEYAKNHPFLNFLRKLAQAPRDKYNPLVNTERDKVEGRVGTQAATLRLAEENRKKIAEAKEWEIGNRGITGRAARGVRDAATSVSTYDFGGLYAMKDASAIYEAADRWEKGKATDADQDLLDAYVLQQEIESKYSEALGGMYAAGKGLVENAQFMGQIAMSPFMSLGKAAAYRTARLLTKYWAKKFGNGIASKVARGVLSLGLKSAKKSTRAWATGAKMAGDVVGGTATSEMFGQQKMMADFINRRVGEVQRNGNGGYTIIRPAEGTWESLRKAHTANAIENWSEVALDGFPGLNQFGKWVGKGINKEFGYAGVLNAFNWLDSRQWKKMYDAFQARTHWSGLWGEYVEEVVGNAGNAAFVGDMTFDCKEGTGVFNAKVNRDTFLSVALMCGFMSAVSSVGYGVDYHRANTYKKKCDRAGQDYFGAEWASWRERIDNADDAELSKIMEEIGNDRRMSDVKKRALLNYEWASAYVHGANMMQLKRKAEGLDNARQHAYADGRNAKGDQKHQIQRDYSAQTTSLAKKLGITDAQLLAMTDDQILSFAGQSKEMDAAIEDFMNVQTKMQGVYDQANDDADVEAESARRRVELCTDKSTGKVRPAMAQGVNGAEDHEVYIVSGRVATHEDGTIDVSNSDSMILYYNPETGQVEHGDASTFTSLGEEHDAQELSDKAYQEARRQSIEAATDEMNGKLKEGSTFTAKDSNGNEHTYQVLSINEDGTANVSMDGQVIPDYAPTLDELQQLKDGYEEQQKNEQAEQISQDQKQQADLEDKVLGNDQSQTETAQPEVEDNMPYDRIANEQTGNVTPVTVLDEDGEERFPNAQGVFLYNGNEKGKATDRLGIIVVDGEGKTTKYMIKRSQVQVGESTSVDEYKQARQAELQQEQVGAPVDQTAPVVDNAQTEEAAPEETAPIEEQPIPVDEQTQTTETAPTTEQEQAPVEPTSPIEQGQTSTTETAPVDQDQAQEQHEPITLSDGTVLPQREDGSPDLLRMTPEQAAQLYHEQYGEAASAYLDADLKAAQDEYRKAQKMKTDAKGWFDRRKQVAEQKEALARAQQTYDNVKAIYDAYHSKYGKTETEHKTEEKPWTKENRAQKVEENKVLTDDTAEATIGSQAYNAITKIAKLMGVNLVWLKHADANGWYDKDSNTVYLALDAERAISMVFGHEMLHEMRAQNKSAYEAMKATAKALLGAKYKDVFDKTRELYIKHKKEMLTEGYKKKGYGDDLIQYILDEQEKNGTLLSDDYIEEEIVADAIGGMINDFDLAKDIALRLDHPTLYAMKQAVDKVAGLFGKTNPYGKQARALGKIIYDAYNRTRNKEEYSAEELKAMNEKAEQSIKADEAKRKAEEEAKDKQNGEEQKEEGKTEEGEQTEDKPTDIKPVGRNKFGNVYSQFRGKPKEGFDFLLKNKSGYLSGVFYRDEIGDIDLAYGDATTIHTGKGLAHIIKKHVDFYGDFDSVDDAINKITDVVLNGIVTSNKNGGYDILKDGYKVVVASDEAGKWVLSAFDSVTSKKEKLRNREKKGAATNQTPGLPNDGAGAVAPNLSTAKLDNSADTSKENDEEVKQSLREEKENDTSTGVSSMIDAANKSDDGIRFNLRTEKDVQDKLRNYVASEVEKPGSISDWTATDIDGVLKETEWLINQIHTALNGNPRYDEWAQREPTVRRDWRDGEMHPIVTWARGNIEYKYDVSADLLCINNEALESTLAMPDMVEFMYLINKSSKKGYTADDYMRLYKTMRDLGINVPCKGCFDAAGRLKMLPSVSRKFVAAVNKVIDERNKNPEQFDEALRSMNVSTKTVNGLPAKSKNKTEAIRVGVAGDNLTEHVSWTQLMSAEGQTKALSDWGGIFRAWQRTGAGRPKDKLLPEPYDGVLTDNTFTIIGAYGEKTPSFRDMEVNVSTGLRRNSHSEFRPILAIDEIQFVRDAFVKNLMVFKYMKEIDDVRLFGKMGIKYNMSFFPAFDAKGRAAGLDADGNYIASEESVGSREFIYHDENGKQHFDGMKGLQEAMKYVNKDVSLSSVVFSVPHLLKALTDVPTHKDKNGMWGSLIPFHASGATAGQLYEQGLGHVRAINTKHPFSVEAFEDYDKGVTNFEQVQDDRFGEGWEILEGKKAGTKVNPGHKLEFANGNHYYNSALGVHLFSSWYVFDKDIKPEHREGMMGGDADVKKEVKSYAGQGYSIDYNDKVREIGGKQPYKDAADYYIEALKGIGLIPRFDFDVSEDKFLEMCDVAGVDPNHPKLGWKGKGHSWSPIDSDAYYSVFCDYGMTDPETGEYSPHRPVGYIDEQGNRTFKLPDNAVDIIKEGVDRYTKMRDHEDSMHKQVMEEYVKRTVEDGKITQKQADEFLKQYESSDNDGIKQSLREGNMQNLSTSLSEGLAGIEDKDGVDRAVRASIDAMPEGWKQANQKLINIAHALADNRKAELDGKEPKFSVKENSLIKSGTYFSGGGLVEEGLKGLIDPVLAVEYDEKISGVYSDNHGNHIVTADVRDVDPEKLLAKIDGNVEYFHASPVCKNYSKAKNNHEETELDVETARSTAEFISKAKPRVVTIENVKGYRNSDAMNIITKALTEGGYDWDADVYNAADFGGYTNRERLIVRAIRGGKLPEKPKHTARKSGWLEAVDDIIDTLPEKKNGIAKWMDERLKADGIDWRNVDRPLYVMGSGFANGRVGHAYGDELLPTLRTKSGDVIVMPGGKVCKVTGRVLARVTGIGDDYKMPHSEALSHTIIGNGVPVQLTRGVIAPLLQHSEPKFSIRPKHGSGADFDHFDHSHMGEGEGAQAYGWGSYVTEVDGIARGYAKKDAKSRFIKNHEFTKLESAYKNAEREFRGAVEETEVWQSMIDEDKRRLEWLNRLPQTLRKDDSLPQKIKSEIENYEKNYERALFTAEEAEAEMNESKKNLDVYLNGRTITDVYEEMSNADLKGKRHLYTVEIPDDNGKNYLDWDKPLTDEQRTIVVQTLISNPKKAAEFIFDNFEWFDLTDRELVKMHDNPESFSADDYAYLMGKYLNRIDWEGGRVYRGVQDVLGSDKAASLALNAAGFTGIRYPAEYRSGGRKDGAKNYVIFNEKDIKIVDHERFSLRNNQKKDGRFIPKDVDKDVSLQIENKYENELKKAMQSANPEERDSLKQTAKEIVEYYSGASKSDIDKNLNERKVHVHIRSTNNAQIFGQGGFARNREVEYRIAEIAAKREMEYRKLRARYLRDHFGLRAGQTVGIGFLEDVFKKGNRTPEVDILFEKIYAINKRLNPEVRIREEHEGGASGSSNIHRQICLYIDGLSKTSTTEEEVPTCILHEMIHQATSGAIHLFKSGKADGMLTPTQIEGVNDILQLYDKASNRWEGSEDEHYGSKNAYEFTAEMADQKQRDELNPDVWTRVVDFVKDLKNTGDDSFWHTFVKAVKKLFGITPSDKVKMDKAIDKVIDGFNENVNDIAMLDVGKNSWAYNPGTKESPDADKESEEPQMSLRDGNESSEPLFSLRDSYDTKMSKWKARNGLADDAQPMEKPVRGADESIGDFMNRMAQYAKDQALWKTAPRPTGFSEALEQWKQDNGIPADQFRPSIPRKADYATDDEYRQARDQYKQEMEKWKGAPKASDYDLSVELDKLSTQMRDVRAAMINQRNFDRQTVKGATDMIRTMLTLGWGDNMSRGRIGQLLSKLNNINGNENARQIINDTMDVLTDNYLKALDRAYKKMTSNKGVRMDDSGVIKIGSLDKNGQAFVDTYNKALTMTDDQLDNFESDLTDQLSVFNNDFDVVNSKLDAVDAARNYRTILGGIDMDMENLQNDIASLKNKKGLTDAEKERLASLQNSLSNLKISKVNALQNFLGNFSETLTQSREGAANFRKKQKQRRGRIMSMADEDMQGMDATSYNTDTLAKWFWNSSPIRFIMSSTHSFEQFLKFFGRGTTLTGKGRLYNHFMSEWNEATDSIQTYKEQNRNALDAKAKELFGKGTSYADLVGKNFKGYPGMEIEVDDWGNEDKDTHIVPKRTIRLTQGNMLYIYLANKQTDGAMKLRKMGITEDKVDEIENALNPKLKELGDWLQNEYLPQCQRRYQEVHTKYFGAAMDEVENYFPLVVNAKDRFTKVDVNQQNQSNLSSTTTGAIITRRVNSTALDVENADALSVAYNHLEEMEDWAGMLPFRQDINTLLSYKKFSNQVKNMSSKAYGSGEELWKAFMATAQIAAGTYQPKTSKTDKALLRSIGFVTMGKIAIRLYTASKQFLSFPAFLPEVGVRGLAIYAGTAINPKGSYEWAMRHLPQFRKRCELMTVGDPRIQDAINSLDGGYRKFARLMQKGMLPNIFIDAMTCATGARAVYMTTYERLKRMGYPEDKAEEKAMLEASMSYNLSQQSSESAYLSPLQVDRDYLSAALSVFKNSNYAYGRQIIDAARGISQNIDMFTHPSRRVQLIDNMKRQIMDEDGLDEDTAEAIAKKVYNNTKWKNIGVLATYIGLLPVLWAAGGAAAYLVGGDDDKKKWRYLKLNTIQGLATSLTDDYAIPFLSTFLKNSIVLDGDGKISWDPSGAKYQDLYVTPAKADIANLLSSLSGLRYSEAEWQAFTLAAQAVTGWNPQTIGSLCRAIYEAYNGDKNYHRIALEAASGPEQSIRDLFIDELNLNGKHKSGATVDDVSRRYAERQITQRTGFFGYRSKEEYDKLIEKYQKSFEKRIQEEMDAKLRQDPKQFDNIYDNTKDEKLKAMMDKSVQKKVNEDNPIPKKESNGEAAYDTIYRSMSNMDDKMNDAVIKNKNARLKNRLDSLNDVLNRIEDVNAQDRYLDNHPEIYDLEDLLKFGDSTTRQINKLKKKLPEASKQEREDIMAEIREIRNEYMQELDKFK